MTFFPLSWTVVHPIDASSPMYGMTAEDLTETDAEFVVRLTAYDETTGQTVHVRTSYKADEVKWGAKFVNIIDRNNADGIIRVDVTRLDEIEPAALPAGSPSVEMTTGVINCRGRATRGVLVQEFRFRRSQSPRTIYAPPLETRDDSGNRRRVSARVGRRWVVVIAAANVKKRSAQELSRRALVPAERNDDVKDACMMRTGAPTRCMNSTRGSGRSENRDRTAITGDERTRSARQET